MAANDLVRDSYAISYYHRQMIKHYGKDSSFALGWRDEESQLIRFKVLAGIGDLNGCTVLDAGCGYADLYRYLTDLYPALRYYYGIEQIPELYDEAVKQYSDLKNTSFMSGSFISKQLPTTDYVFASGSLNYGSQDPEFIFKAITKLYNDCTIGLAFNFLREMPVKGLLVAYDREVILNHCRTLTDKITITDDYVDEDITIYLYH
ncbi:class I SAM-dependent methyltransferase [Mucilaginibacter myungsuensis]